MNRKTREAMKKMGHPGNRAVFTRQLRCGGKLHSITWQDLGAVTLHNHSKENIEAMRIARHMGASCPCLDMLDALRSGQWDSSHLLGTRAFRDAAKQAKARSLRRIRAREPRWSGEMYPPAYRSFTVDSPSNAGSCTAREYRERRLQMHTGRIKHGIEVALRYANDNGSPFRYVRVRYASSFEEQRLQVLLIPSQHAMHIQEGSSFMTHNDSVAEVVFNMSAARQSMLGLFIARLPTSLAEYRWALISRVTHVSKDQNEAEGVVTYIRLVANSEGDLLAQQVHKHARMKRALLCGPNPPFGRPDHWEVLGVKEDYL